MIPTHVNLDCENNFPRPLSRSCRQRCQITRLSNGVHPAPAGYRQIWRYIHAWMKAQLSLKRLARENAMPVTLKDIAARVGLSVNSVSGRCGTRTISPLTPDAASKPSPRTRLSPQHECPQPVLKQSFTIGVAVTELNNPVRMDFCERLRQLAEQDGTASSAPAYRFIKPVKTPIPFPTCCPAALMGWCLLSGFRLDDQPPAKSSLTANEPPCQ